LRRGEIDVAEVEIYTTPFCGFCARAKRLLNKKGVAFIEYDLSTDPEKRPEMLKRSNGERKVPQIFIDGRHIGGCDELFELDFDEELDPMLGIAVS
jgi:glutaredoxin 3